MSIDQKLQKKDKYLPYIIPAYKIKEHVQGSDFLTDYINDILLVIQDDIMQAIDSPDKKNYSITEIQTIFDIPNMSNGRAQMYIYFHILRALKKAKYIPKIKIIGTNPRTQRVYIYVRWLNDDDIEMEKYMNSFIKAHSFDKTLTEIDAPDAKPIARRRRKSIL